jgi:hypothetical protein
MSTLRTAGLAVIPGVLLLFTSACKDESDTTGPVAAAQSQAPQASLGAIPTDGILDLISGREAAWAAKDAAAYVAAFATNVHLINPRGRSVLGAGRVPRPARRSLQCGGGLVS